MRKSNIIDYKNPSQNLVTDVLSEFLRESAQKMLQLAIEEEGQNFISSYQDKLLTNGSKQVVRNGYLPERNIQTGIGEVAVKVPRVRDRGKEYIKFSSNLIPQYMRRTVTIDVLLPLLYLKGISTTDLKGVDVFTKYLENVLHIADNIGFDGEDGDWRLRKYNY
jgi:transposase-like protein